MKKSNLTWSVKKFVKDVTKGVISFEHPLQRRGEQWTPFQKSLLIHSLVDDSPVPALFSIKEKAMVPNEEGVEEEKDVYFVLDGKQRLTSIVQYVTNKYPLVDSIPPVEIDGETYELAGKRFTELDEEVQDQINSFNLLMYKMEEPYTDEQIEFLFFKLNNGTALTKTQQAKSKMGIEWAKRMKEITEHKLMTEKASFTKMQVKKADDETALIQTMMLLDETFNWKDISSESAFEYTQLFRMDEENKLNVYNKVVEGLDYLSLAFDDAEGKKESVLMKKIHIPMLILTALEAKAIGKQPEEFRDWAEEFKKALQDKSSFPTDYKEHGGAGSVKKPKTEKRIAEMSRHMRAFFNITEIKKNDEIEKNVEEMTAS